LPTNEKHFIDHDNENPTGIENVGSTARKYEVFHHSENELVIMTPAIEIGDHDTCDRKRTLMRTRSMLRRTSVAGCVQLVIVSLCWVLC
jgi:hypothetical protein